MLKFSNNNYSSNFNCDLLTKNQKYIVEKKINNTTTIKTISNKINNKSNISNTINGNKVNAITNHSVDISESQLIKNHSYHKSNKLEVNINSTKKLNLSTTTTKINKKYSLIKHRRISKNIYKYYLENYQTNVTKDYSRSIISSKYELYEMRKKKATSSNYQVINNTKSTTNITSNNLSNNGKLILEENINTNEIKINETDNDYHQIEKINEQQQDYKNKVNEIEIIYEYYIDIKEPLEFETKQENGNVLNNEVKEILIIDDISKL